MKATEKDLWDVTAILLFQWAKPRNRHLLRPEWEDCAIRLIKSQGTHIGDPEAKEVLKKLRIAFGVS